MCTYKHTCKRTHTQSDSHATTANQSVLELGTKEEIPFDILYNKAVSHYSITQKLPLSQL